MDSGSPLVSIPGRSPRSPRGVVRLAQFSTGGEWAKIHCRVLLPLYASPSPIESASFTRLRSRPCPRRHLRPHTYDPWSPAAAARPSRVDHPHSRFRSAFAFQFFVGQGLSYSCEFFLFMLYWVASDVSRRLYRVEPSGKKFVRVWLGAASSALSAGLDQRPAPSLLSPEGPGGIPCPLDRPRPYITSRSRRPNFPFQLFSRACGDSEPRTWAHVPGGPPHHGRCAHARAVRTPGILGGHRNLASAPRTAGVG